MSDPIPARGSEWKQLVPENVDFQHQGGDQDYRSKDKVDAAFRLFYEPSKDPDTQWEFIPLYAEAEIRKTLPSEAAVGAAVSGQDEAPPDSEEIRRCAYEEGYSHGKQEGFASGQAEADGIVERMQTLLAGFDGLWQHLVETHEAQLIELVCRVSEKVILGQAAIDNEMIRRSILDAFRKIPEPVEATIEINPEDAECVEAIKEDFFKQIQALKHITLIPDPSVTQGGCRLKTRFGEVDTTIESRLDSIKRTLMDVYSNRLKNEDNR